MFGVPAAKTQRNEKLVAASGPQVVTKSNFLSVNSDASRAVRPDALRDGRIVATHWLAGG
jgi:hypothetical protein